MCDTSKDQADPSNSLGVPQWHHLDNNSQKMMIPEICRPPHDYIVVIPIGELFVLKTTLRISYLGITRLGKSNPISTSGGPPSISRMPWCYIDTITAHAGQLIARMLQGYLLIYSLSPLFPYILPILRSLLYLDLPLQPLSVVLHLLLYLQISVPRRTFPTLRSHTTSL